MPWISSDLGIATMHQLRQAWRSIHIGAKSVSEWRAMLDFFTPEHRSVLKAVVNDLERGLPRSLVRPTSLRFPRVVRLAIRILQLPLLLIWNRISARHWIPSSLTAEIVHDLKVFIGCLDEQDGIELQAAIDLRQELCGCEMYLEWYLKGTARLDSGRIDHFGYPVHFAAPHPVTYRAARHG